MTPHGESLAILNPNQLPLLWALVKLLVLKLGALDIDIGHRLVDPLRNPPGGLVQDGHGCWHK